MDKYEHQIIMHRIKDIAKEQIHYLEYVCDKIDFMVDVQKENIQERMQQFWEEKSKLTEYIK